MKTCYVFWIAFFCFAILLGSPMGSVTDAFAQYSSNQLSVSISATVKEQPPTIVLSWPKDDSALSYSVYKRNASTGNWDPMGNIKKLLTWTDTNVQLGVGYEYSVRKVERVKGNLFPGFGYVYTGIDLPAQEFSGTVDLIVDDTFATNLSMELDRLRDDLIVDGWNVRRHDIKRSAKVTDIKAIIVNDYTNDNTLRSVFLFGHVPVPYSGQINPDGHPNHLGAWPADVYYADMNGSYTDESVNVTGSSVLQANWNVPGDGRFDQSTVASNADLEIGRVDLSDMPAFALSEKELLRKYLDKDHAFRIGALTAPRRALIVDNFGTYGEGFASDGWRNFPNFVGSENINSTAGWFSTLDTAAYLWAYGCGGGGPTGASGIGSTDDFAKFDIKAIFTMLFGSYFGDWNVQNDFLRAPLGSGSALTCAWAGRPHWYVHHMAMGETIGFGTRLTQNNIADYDPGFGSNFVHIALMGDPTLRMAYNRPTSDFAFVRATPSQDRHSVAVTWSTTKPAESYNVYRKHHAADDYLKLNDMPITTTTFTDTKPFSDSDIYVVRAVAKLGGIHGTYFTAGLPSASVVTTGLAGVSPSETAMESSGTLLEQNFPNPVRGVTSITFMLNRPSQVKLVLSDVTGKLLGVLADTYLGAGRRTVHYDASQLSPGTYYYTLMTPQTTRTRVLTVEK